MARADLGSTMAAVATAPAGLGADDAARLLAPPPVEDVQFYSALTPRDSPFSPRGERGHRQGVLDRQSAAASERRGRRRTTRATAKSPRRNTSSTRKARRSRCARPTFPSCCLPTTPGRAKNPRRRRSHGRGLFFSFFSRGPSRRRALSPSRRERTRRLSRRHVRSRSALTDLRFAISPSPEKKQRSSRSRSFARSVVRRRRARYRLWKEAPEQWLLKSKIGWSTRHETSGARRRARRRRPWRGLARLTRLGGRPAAAAGPPTPASARARLGDAGRRDRRARAQRGFAQDARRRGLDAPWAGGAVDHVPGPDVARRAGRGGRDRVQGPDVLLAQRVGHPLQAPQPGKKADDGWKSVRYGSAEGPTLHDVKLAFLAGVGRGTPVPRGERERQTARRRSRRSASRGRSFPWRARVRARRATASAGRGWFSASPARTRRRSFFLRRRKKRRRTKSRPARDAGEAPARGRGRGRTRASVREEAFGALRDGHELARGVRGPGGRGGRRRARRALRRRRAGGDHASLLGRTVQVFWPSEETWHAGRVLRVEPGAGGASVLYATGDVEQGVVLDALAEKGHLFVL